MSHAALAIVAILTIVIFFVIGEVFGGAVDKLIKSKRKKL